MDRLIRHKPLLRSQTLAFCDFEMPWFTKVLDPTVDMTLQEVTLGTCICLNKIKVSASGLFIDDEVLGHHSKSHTLVMMFQDSTSLQKVMLG